MSDMTLVNAYLKKKIALLMPLAIMAGIERNKSFGFVFARDFRAFRVNFTRMSFCVQALSVN